MIRREKLFGQGRATPLDREAKAKLMHRARALLRAKRISPKTFFVFEALLWSFHNGRSGRCFPSYERIARLAGCVRSTVALSITMLEAAKLLSWHNRIIRIRFNGVLRVIRTSNAYQFPGSGVSKSDVRTGTSIKSFSLEEGSALGDALLRLRRLMQQKTQAKPG